MTTALPIIADAAWIAPTQAALLFVLVLFVTRFVCLAIDEHHSRSREDSGSLHE